MINPTCLFHGKKRDEHFCLYCCLCFKDLCDPETGTLYADIYQDDEGIKWDMCMSCKAHEDIMMEEMNGED